MMPYLQLEYRLVHCHLSHGFLLHFVHRVADLRPVMMMCAPNFARPIAVSLPIPLVPPVMMIVLPCIVLSPLCDPSYIRAAHISSLEGGELKEGVEADRELLLLRQAYHIVLI